MRCNGESAESSRFVSVRSKYSNSNVYNVNTSFLSLEKASRSESNNSISCATAKMSESGIENEVSFLVPLFNFFYYLLLVPFKTVLDKGTNKYFLETFTLQKISCLLLHIVVVFFFVFCWFLAGIHFQVKLEPNIVMLFDFVSNFTSCMSIFLTILILWRKRQEYLEVIECTRVTVKRVKIITTSIYLFIMVSSIAWGTINWFMLHDPGHYASLQSLDKYIFDRNASSYNLIGAHSPDILKCAIYAGVNVVVVHISLFYIIAHGPFIMLVFALRQLAKEFRIQLKSTIDIQQGNELYRRLKRKADLITKLFGNNLLAYYITAVCYYSEAPHVLLGKRGDTEKAAMVYFGLTSVVWILAADFHKNIQETVLEWIAFHTDNADLVIEDRLRLVAISNEMSADPVALASRYFYVTYQHFSSMLGLVVTYGIIVFQLHNGPPGNS